MPDLGKGGLPGGAHTLRRRVGGGQVRVLGLEFPEFDDEGIELGVRFALSTPGIHAFCTPSDPETARRAIGAAAHFAPISDDERTAVAEDAGGDESIFPLAGKAVSPWR